MIQINIDLTKIHHLLLRLHKTYSFQNFQSSIWSNCHSYLTSSNWCFIFLNFIKGKTEFWKQSFKIVILIWCFSKSSCSCIKIYYSKRNHLQYFCIFRAMKRFNSHHILKVHLLLLLSFDTIFLFLLFSFRIKSP